MRTVEKRWLMLMVTIILSFGVLVGCSSKTSSSQENQKDNGQTSKEKSAGGESSSGDKLSGDLEIQYFVGGYGDEWWKAVIKEFETKHPNLTIKQDAGPKINEKMRTRWISGNPPDVIYIDGNGTINETQMVEDGQLMDLTDWAQGLELSDGTPLVDHLIVPPHKFDGKIYSMPLIFDSRGIWYDKAWFQKEGFDVPKDFPSWMASMKKIKQKADISPFITTGKYPVYFLQGVLYPAFASVGGEELLNNVIDGKKGVWKSDKVKNAMNRVRKMIDSGYVDKNFAGISHTQSQADWLNHKNAYIPVGFWLPNEMKKDTPKGFEYAFIPTPMNAKGKPMVLTPRTTPIGIAKKAKNPEAAKAFIKFVFQKKYAKKFPELSGALINMKGVDLASDPKVPEYLKQASKMINSDKVSVYSRKHEMSADMSNSISDALVPLLSGKTSIDQFTDKAEEITAKYRSSK